jgi:hypothetical protein
MPGFLRLDAPAHRLKTAGMFLSETERGLWDLAQ